MYSNDIAKITPPVTLAELAALDATREVPYLKARCNRMGIHVPGNNPSPAEIIPHIQTRLAAHITRGQDFLSQCSGDYAEWKLICEEYEEFVACLQSLLASAAETKTDTKPEQNRDESGTPAQPVQNQTTSLEQNRNETETDPEQNRYDSETPTVNSQKSTPASNEGFKISETPTADSAPPTADLTPAQRKAIKAKFKNMDIVHLAEFVTKAEFLPDPKKCTLTEYCNAFMEWAGPPRRVRLDQAEEQTKILILSLIEEYSLKKVQTKLALPPPFGPYILTSKASLSRFGSAQHARQARRNHRAVQKHINHFLQACDTPEADYNSAAENLLRAQLVQATLHPEPDLKKTKTLVDMLEKIRAGKLAERKLESKKSA